jgi:hypothetical protein
MNLIKITILNLFLGICCFQAFSQNLFDNNHSLTFTNFLFKTHQYNFATIELEKLNFLSPGNDSLSYLLLKSYRLSKQVVKGIQRSRQIFSNEKAMPVLPSTEFCYLLISNKEYAVARQFLDLNTNINNNFKVRMNLHISLMNKEWKSANDIYNQNYSTVEGISVFKPMIDEGLKLKRKSPFLAGMFSTLVPGLGKVYTSYWKDGLLALLSIGTSSWQAYNGFHRDGTKSAYGWVFGSLATVFYLSTIYGSQKSAKVYNRNQEDKILHQVEYLLPLD